MTWQPISESELKSQVQHALSQLSEADSKKFGRIQTPPHRIPCKRNAQTLDEEIFVVARVGSKVLVFDDVEDEFGVGDLGTSAVLEGWELLGDLANALSRF